MRLKRVGEYNRPGAQGILHLFVQISIKYESSEKYVTLPSIAFPFYIAWDTVHCTLSGLDWIDMDL